MIWESPKDPDVSDRYGIVLEDGWLDGELITNVTFEASVESGLTITNVSIIDQPEVSAMFSGGNEGFWSVKIRINTPTRQREICATLWVRQGC